MCHPDLHLTLDAIHLSTDHHHQCRLPSFSGARVGVSCANVIHCLGEQSRPAGFLAEHNIASITVEPKLAFRRHITVVVLQERSSFSKDTFLRIANSGRRYFARSLVRPIQNMADSWMGWVVDCRVSPKSVLSLRVQILTQMSITRLLLLESKTTK